MYTGGTHCSAMLSLSTLVQNKLYKAAVENCSGFVTMGFDGVCGRCLAAVSEVKREMMEEFGVGSDDQNENGACGFAAIVAVAAARIEDRSDFDAFFQCLPALDAFSKFFILFYSLEGSFKN